MASPEDQQPLSPPIERLLRAELSPPGRSVRRLRLVVTLAMLTALSAGSVALLVTLVRLLGPWGRGQ